MLLRLGVSILFGHAKIHHMNDIGGFRSGSTNQKVVRLDITVDEVLLVDCLDSRELLKISIRLYFKSG